MMLSNFKSRMNGFLDRRFTAHGSHVDARLDALEQSLAAESARRSEAERALQSSIDALDRSVNVELRELIRPLVSEEPRNRRALHELRSQADYELPFTTPDPLVSICVSTIPGREQLLLERALPSALGQTHSNVEVIVVGNMVGSEIADGIAALGDDRVRFTNLTHRVKHPDPDREWLKAGAMGLNEANRQAQGLWITELDDDDALRPDAIEQLLELAQSHQVEVAYGVLEQHDPEGGQSTMIGAFPPGPTDDDWREKGLVSAPWQGRATSGAIAHHGLKLFAREHVAADLDMPGDLFKLERMVRAGVRFAMLERVVYDYYPSKAWS
jgi:hypothetical protein